MKNQLLIIGCCLLFGSSIFGQSVPQGMNYQAVARDLTGQILADQEISVKLILKSGDSDENNATAYTEIHYVKTNAFGLINLVVGEGSVVKGKFSHIPWSSQNIWMDISIDNAGGENYEHLTTSKLLTVPYAFHAATASSLTEDIIDREDLQKKKAKKEWRTEGNKDIDSSENYLGTLDAAPLIVITNDSPRLIVHSDGAIEIMGEVTAASFVGDGSQLSGINSDDADSDPSNEYNTALALSGTQLDITDGGATLSADLSSLEESAEVEAAQADATQALSAAYVSQTTANDAVVAASLAQSSADNAQDSADNAETNANQALSNAADAQASAVNAQADATQGINDAAHAQAAANMAQATADNAQNDATQAISDAANAQASANMAQTTADNAQSDATQGINDAAHAQSSANIAQTTADGAQTDATQAITDAANAQATANNAAQAIDQHAVDDADTDNTNELNSSFALTGNNLEIADASGTLSVDLSALDNADDAAHAQAAANMAQATADNAQTDATQAITDAANAQASANMAQTTADNAQSDATQGINDAAHAQSSANIAQTTADGAQTDATQAITDAANAQATANNAAQAIDQHAVDDADTDNTNELNSSFALNGNNLEIADASGTLSVDLSALDNADDAAHAQAAANMAQATADNAQNDATQAISDAANAQASANMAQTTADNAQSDATQGINNAANAQAMANHAANAIDQHALDDADTDNTNELNSSFALTGNNLEIADASGTLSVDLSVLDNADDAMAAQSAANQALAEALAAQAAANQALLDAMAAQQKADDAIASASLAQNTANTANSTAGQALSSATSAQSAANSAQITATQGLSAAAIAHNKIDSHVSVDQDLSSTNEIELPAGGQQGQLLSTDGNGTYNWTDDNGITVNAQNNELTAWNGNSLVGSSVTRTSSGINVNGNINATSANLSGILISGAINTGLGTTEVHLMNQNLRSNDDVSFNSMNLSRLSINNKWFFTDSNNSEWLYLRNQANNAYFGGIAVGKFYSEGTARVRGNTGLDADLSVEGTTNLNGQVNISGVDLNTLIDQKVRNYVRSRCYIRFGWRDSANGQLTPSKYVKVRADKSAWEYCTDCTAGDGWASVNADGDVNGDDNFYIQFECL